MDVNEAVESQYSTEEYHRRSEREIRALQKELDKLRGAYDWASNAASLLVLALILGGAITIVMSLGDAPRNNIAVGALQIIIGISLTVINTWRIRREQKSQ